MDPDHTSSDDEPRRPTFDLGRLQLLAEQRGTGITEQLLHPDPEILALRTDAAVADAERRWRAITPARFRYAQLEDLLADEPDHEILNSRQAACQILDEWAEAEPMSAGNVLIAGPVGTGKTYAALAALRAAQLAGADVDYTPVVELLDDLRPGGREHRLAELQLVERLVVDDIGTQRDTDWTAERLYALINRRWLEQLPTITTTNLTPAELKAAVGERIYSRLTDGACIRLKGPDRRRTA